MNGWMTAGLVGLGGALGSLARYGVTRLSYRLWGAAFPWGTIMVNVSGAFLLGFVATYLFSRFSFMAEALRLSLAIGFLGAYTTFSTFEWESHQLFQTGNWWAACANLIGSVAAGLVAIRLGAMAAQVWSQ